MREAVRLIDEEIAQRTRALDGLLRGLIRTSTNGVDDTEDMVSQHVDMLNKLKKIRSLLK